MKSNLRYFVIAFSLLGFPSAATHSAVHSVPGSFSSIQSAITGANSGDTIVVGPGIYVENIIWSGKTLRVIGAGMDSTSLRPSNSNQPILQISGGAGSVLSGFMIENAGNANYAVRLFAAADIEITQNCFRKNVLPFGVNIEVVSIDGASPYIHHNLFVENGGIACVGIRDGINAKIWNNTFDRNNRGVFCIAPGHGDLRNNSITSNNNLQIGGYGVFGQFGTGGYNNVFSNGNIASDNYTAGATPKPGDIGSNPLYVDPINGDYRYQAGSPNIDAGDPALLDADSTRSDIGNPTKVVLNPTAGCSGSLISVPGDYSTIQMAINAAGACDTILVSPGTYFEHLSIAGKSVILLSVGGSTTTILSGTGAYQPVVHFSSGSRGALKGFTVTNGRASGILVSQAGPRIEECVLTRNSNYGETGDGGAVQIIQSDRAVICNNRIYRNTAGTYGGAIGVAGGSGDTIRNNLIYANLGFSDIRSLNYIAALHDNTISSNSYSAGIELRLSGNLDVRSNIVCYAEGSAGIYDDQSEMGTMTAQYNGTFSNVPVNFNFSVDSTNISSPALFVDSVNNDYHLAAGSQYIDSGDPDPLFNDADLTRNDIGADLTLVPDSVCCLPTLPPNPLCCVGSIGNIDCDPLDVMDIADLTQLVNHLFLTFEPLCCPKEADFDPTGSTPMSISIDISDLSRLIDFLFVVFSPPPACQ
jgi:hypothetical protein